MIDSFSSEKQKQSQFEYSPDPDLIFSYIFRKYISEFAEDWIHSELLNLIRFSYKQWYLHT